MPLILGANSVSGGYEVDNSLRFNSGSSDYLNKTSFGTATNRKIFTFSFWVKKTTNGDKMLFSAGTNSSTNVDQIYFRYPSDITQNTFDVLFYESSVTKLQLRTTQYFRDPSAWYHFVVAIDSTQATDTNRAKVYLNGSQITSFSTATYPSQNAEFLINSTGSHYIAGNLGASFTLDGYLSEFYFIDGQQLTPSSFGETDEDTNIWKPIPYTGSFGTNGFYLEFKDSSALGDDTSGNSNDFTVNNLTSIDQTTDTPTNNFATFNPLYSSSGTGFTNGNLDYQNTVVSWKSSLSNIAVNKGKWYAEFKYILRDNASAEYGWAGICDVQQAETYSATWLGSAVSSGTGIAYGTQAGDIYGNNVSLGSGTNPALNDIIGIAMDLDNNFVYFSLNGTFQNSGVPTSGASGTGGFAISTAVSKFYVFGASSYDSSKWSANFGNPAFTISSGNADGNGIGNFEYAVPSGYFALCTKNLAQYG